MSEPSQSIPSLLRIISSFQNLSKSEALPLTAYCQTSAFQPGSFQWPKGIRYLGVLLPPQLKDLIKVNFNPLLYKITCDTSRWATLNLSMVGKVSVVKMNCVPKLNYLIHTIPLEIPMSYFKWYDRIVKTFIWNCKTPFTS